MKNVERMTKSEIVKEYSKRDEKEQSFLFGKGDVKGVFHKWTPEEEKKAYANKARMKELEAEYKKKNKKARRL